MNEHTINQIIEKFSHERLSASPQELALEKYIQERLGKIGLTSTIEPFETETYRIYQEELRVDDQAIFCKAYYGCQSDAFTAPLYYAPKVDDLILEECCGKLVIIDERISEEILVKLGECGAKGIITHGGGVHLESKFLRRGELRFARKLERILPSVTIGAEDFIRIIRDFPKEASLCVTQETMIGQSHNLVLELPGETDEWIVLAAHTDTTEESLGVYDNLSGCICLLAIAEHFAHRKLKRGLRFLWCGSEERGLLGSFAYCRQHKAELEKVILNITLDMLGSITGAFSAFACANKESETVLKDFAERKKVVPDVRYVLRSTDVKPFVYYGVPAISFARYAPSGIAPIHTKYDTPEAVSAEMILKDAAYITDFVDEMATTENFPIPREIAEDMQKEAEEYVKYTNP